ncbi:MAG: LacI family DNA-binding transcriptional regulator, partial [Phycisphaerales bacterium]|nr:LacI family DNA-binding transcriptional regulator [Phycisphaerales bacterium]
MGKSQLINGATPGEGHGHDQHKPSLITDVARLANVSTATVSRVLNTPEVVAPATAERVREAMSELRYRPNIFAKGLVSRTSRVLGIIMPDFMGEFYTQLLQSADTVAREHGYHVVVTSDTRLGSADAVQSLPLNFLDGIIALLTFPDRKLTKSLVDLNMPMVLIDTEEGVPGIDRVRIENEPGARQAAMHLLDSVAPADCFHVGGPASNFDAKDRAKAFGDVLRER